MRLAEEHRSVFVPNGEVQQQLGRILVLSDAAHSFGATIGDKRVGAIADITGFSFHAVKNLTTAEGGALAFNMPKSFDNEALYKLFNAMSLHGQSKDALAKTQPGAWRYDVTMAGWKCNMTDLQAAIGLVELDRYDSETIPTAQGDLRAVQRRLSVPMPASLPQCSLTPDAKAPTTSTCSASRTPPRRSAMPSSPPSPSAR